MAQYERNEQQQGCRSGYYSRNRTTFSRDVTLKVQKLKRLSFEATIIERYRCWEICVKEALIEMYLADISVWCVEDIAEVLWGSKVSSSTISVLNKKAYALAKPSLQGELSSYVHVDGPICAETGAEGLRTRPFWWRLR